MTWSFLPHVMASWQCFSLAKIFWVVPFSTWLVELMLTESLYMCWAGLTPYLASIFLHTAAQELRPSQTFILTYISCKTAQITCTSSFYLALMLSWSYTTVNNIIMQLFSFLLNFPRVYCLWWWLFCETSTQSKPCFPLGWLNRCCTCVLQRLIVLLAASY